MEFFPSFQIFPHILKLRRLKRSEKTFLKYETMNPNPSSLDSVRKSYATTLIEFPTFYCNPPTQFKYLEKAFFDHPTITQTSSRPPNRRLNNLRTLLSPKLRKTKNPNLKSSFRTSSSVPSLNKSCSGLSWPPTAGYTKKKRSKSGFELIHTVSLNDQYIFSCKSKKIPGAGRAYGVDQVRAL